MVDPSHPPTRASAWLDAHLQHLQVTIGGHQQPLVLTGQELHAVVFEAEYGGDRIPLVPTILAATAHGNPKPLRPATANTPTLIVEGGLDAVAPPRWATQISVRLPHTTIIVVPAWGHQPTFANPCTSHIAADFTYDPTHLDSTKCVAKLPKPFTK